MISDPNERCELLPCPFCGETDALQVRSDCYIRCGSCGVEGPCDEEIRDDASEAIRLWNTRSEQRWQAIETAPKDGSLILVCGRWDEGPAWWGLGHASVAGVYGHWDDNLGPSHWQPLPEPPHPNEEQN